jgi:thymidylate synthase (FAD)
MNVRLIWITPEAERLIVYMARVSNPDNQDNPNIAGLIRYCMNKGHWSIFEMANACFEIETGRAISHQIIRHWSIRVQEYSQRYAEPQGYEPVTPTQQTGRQAATVVDDPHLIEIFGQLEAENWDSCKARYDKAIAAGFSRESARTMLPEGTRTRLYVNGTFRSWIHFLAGRNEPHAQHDHRLIAQQIQSILAEQMPIIAEAAGWT